MGKVGHKHTEESKAKMRQWHKGKKLTEEHRRNISNAQKGKTISQENIEKLRQVNIGKIVSEETRRKMSESAKKKKLSEEHKRKIAEAGRRRAPISEETRQRLIEAQANRGPRPKASEETRRKMSETRRGKKLTVTDKWKAATIKRAEAMRGKPRSPESIEKHRQTMIGRQFSAEHRERLSKSGKGKHSGPSNPNYIDGRTKKKYPYPGEFTDYLKKKVRIRDGYTCQVCFKEAKGRKGFVHHIDGDKNNCTMENLALVCASCHNSIHSYSPNHTEAIVRFRAMLKPENRPLRSI